MSLSCRDNHHLFAGAVSGLVAARWTNVILAMGSGMPAMILLQLLSPAGSA